MYDLFGLPGFCLPCVGSHSKTSLASSFLLRHTCPANLILCILIVWLIGGMPPYSSLFVICSSHDTFSAARSILVYAPSSFFSRAVVRVQAVDPYTSTDSTAARKKFLLSLIGRLDFQIVSSWLMAPHAFPSLISMSFSVEAI